MSALRSPLRPPTADPSSVLTFLQDCAARAPDCGPAPVAVIEVRDIICDWLVYAEAMVATDDGHGVAAGIVSIGVDGSEVVDYIFTPVVPDVPSAQVGNEAPF